MRTEPPVGCDEVASAQEQSDSDIVGLNCTRGPPAFIILSLGRDGYLQENRCM